MYHTDKSNMMFWMIKYGWLNTWICNCLFMQFSSPEECEPMIARGKLTKRNAKKIDIPIQDSNRVYNHLFNSEVYCGLTSWCLVEFMYDYGFEVMVSGWVHVWIILWIEVVMSGWVLYELYCGLKSWCLVEFMYEFIKCGCMTEIVDYRSRDLRLCAIWHGECLNLPRLLSPLDSTYSCRRPGVCSLDAWLVLPLHKLLSLDKTYLRSTQMNASQKVHLTTI